MNERSPAVVDGEVERLRAEAQIARSQKRYRRALVLYTRLVQLSPGDPLAQLRLGELLIRAGRDAEALAALEASATGYTERREQAKAFAVWRMVLELSPGHAVARDCLASRC